MHSEKHKQSKMTQKNEFTVTDYSSPNTRSSNIKNPDIVNKVNHHHSVNQSGREPTNDSKQNIPIIEEISSLSKGSYVVSNKEPLIRNRSQSDFQLMETNMSGYFTPNQKTDVAFPLPRLRHRSKSGTSGSGGSISGSGSGTEIKRKKSKMNRIRGRRSRSRSYGSDGSLPRSSLNPNFSSNIEKDFGSSPPPLELSIASNANSEYSNPSVGSFPSRMPRTNSFDLDQSRLESDPLDATNYENINAYKVYTELDLDDDINDQHNESMDESEDYSDSSYSETDFEEEDEEVEEDGEGEEREGNAGDGDGEENERSGKKNGSSSLILDTPQNLTSMINEQESAIKGEGKNLFQEQQIGQESIDLKLANLEIDSQGKERINNNKTFETPNKAKNSSLKYVHPEKGGYNDNLKIEKAGDEKQLMTQKDISLCEKDKDLTKLNLHSYGDQDTVSSKTEDMISQKILSRRECGNNEMKNGDQDKLALSTPRKKLQPGSHQSHAVSLESEDLLFHRINSINSLISSEGSLPKSNSQSSSHSNHRVSKKDKERHHRDRMDSISKREKSESGHHNHHNHRYIPDIMQSLEDIYRNTIENPKAYGKGNYPTPKAVVESFNTENSSIIDRRAWLEVEDPNHRYAKNLRIYHKEWEKQGRPGDNFWLWLDEGIPQSASEEVELKEKEKTSFEEKKSLVERGSNNNMNMNKQNEINNTDQSCYSEIVQREPKVHEDIHGSDKLSISQKRVLPELPECPRALLESEVLTYCNTPEERFQYKLEIKEDGLFYRSSTTPKELVDTGSDGWIFVLRDNNIYAAEKKTDKTPRFHHSSFFAGECVEAAALFIIKRGVLRRLYPHSGHYRPTDRHLLRLLRYMEENNINLYNIEVDVQLMLKVARAMEITPVPVEDNNKTNIEKDNEKDPITESNVNKSSSSKEQLNTVKKKKVDSAYIWRGQKTKEFLEHKEMAWKLGIYDAILRRRREKERYRHLMSIDKEKKNKEINKTLEG